jgi:hypothetical protein
MRLDQQAMFFDAKALSGATVTSDALDVKGAVMAELTAYAVARFSNDTHGVTSVELQGSADGSAYVVIGAHAVTDTTAGAGVNIPVPQGCPKYLKMVVKGASMAGTVTGGITLAAPSPRGHRIGDFAAN